MASNNGNVCPFCTDADPKWPDRYMVPTYFNKRRGAHVPSPRYRNIVSVTCKSCGARWSRDSGTWTRPTITPVVADNSAPLSELTPNIQEEVPTCP